MQHSSLSTLWLIIIISYNRLNLAKINTLNPTRCNELIEIQLELMYILPFMICSFLSMNIHN